MAASTREVATVIAFVNDPRRWLRRRGFPATAEVKALASAWSRYWCERVPHFQYRLATREEMEETSEGYEQTLRAVGHTSTEAEDLIAANWDRVYAWKRLPVPVRSDYIPPPTSFGDAKTREGKILEALIFGPIGELYGNAVTSLRVCTLCKKRVLLANRNSKMCSVCRWRYTKQQRWWRVRRRGKANG